MSEFRRPHEFNKKLEVDLNNPRYKFLLMDLHGTIADRQLWSLKGMTQSWKSTFGFNAPKDGYQQALRRGDKTYKQFLGELIEQDNRLEQNHRYESQTKIGKTFDTVMKNIYVPMPGMRRVIRRFIDSGIQIAILTNGPHTDVIKTHLDKWGFPELANNVYNGPVMNIKKPNPEAVHYVINDMDIQNQSITMDEILMIGDHFDDTQVAQNAGIDSALIIRPVVTKSIEIKDPYPTYVIDNPFDLMNVVAGNVEPLPKEQGEVIVHPPFFQ